MSAGGEFLASFCVVEERGAAFELPRLIKLAQFIDTRLKYWEIIYLVGERAGPDIVAAAAQIAQVKNLRIIVVNHGNSYYRRRVIAASEAIGDTVLITSFDELDGFDPVAFVLRAHTSNAIIIARRANVGMPSVVHAVLWLASTYRVDSRDLKTIAVPRAKLESILSRSTSTLDLRFEPKHGGETYVREMVGPRRSIQRGSRIAERYELATELIANAAPRFLKGYAGLACIVMLGAMAYAAYVLGALALVHDLTPGWFSTNIVQAASVAFIAGGVAVLCLGLAEIYERLQGRSRWTIVEEIANIDFYENAKPINVDVETSDNSP